ncbi:MAG: nickel-dependent lactate racemase [Desulfobacterota bacterium]|nr:nickel-dependent lactate racemase [Thermodesulfobacteriota bacterium]
MRQDLKRSLKAVDTTDWKPVEVEFGRQTIEVRLPPHSAVLSMKDVPVLSNPREAIEEAFAHPIGSPPLEEIIRKKGKAPKEMSVAIAVSDITRPVPYKGDSGILGPLLKRLEASGILKEHIKIVVATGMHRPSTHEEKIEMYGSEVVDQYRILDHDCENRDLLESIGTTRRGTHVFVNKDFYFSDLKIVTGLVESHFFTGISGGRKSICPGLVDVKTIQKFHGPLYLEDPRTTNLVLEGNPCHEEALEVAQTVGVDFAINVNLNKELQLVRVFAGEMEESNLKAYELIKSYAEIPIEEEFDIVLTHSGYVGRDHYQTAKAGVGALPAVKPGGTIIIAANNRDLIEPIGSPEYRSLIHLLKLQGPEGYLALLRSPTWRFTKDQWEPEVWGKVLRKVGEEGLIYCSLEIERKNYCLLPGICGLDFLEDGEVDPSLQKARQMVQNAVIYAVGRYRERGIEPTVAFIREGPYAVPILRKGPPLTT